MAKKGGRRFRFSLRSEMGSDSLPFRALETAPFFRFFSYQIFHFASLSYFRFEVKNEKSVTFFTLKEKKVAHFFAWIFPYFSEMFLFLVNMF
jgi:hypothetical protein